MEYAPVVLPILRSMRAIALPHWGTAEVVGIKENRPRNIVTALDLEVEKTISEALRAAYPDIGFVGEETGGDRAGRKFWLMDPIDGTQAFVRGMPFCTSMLALIDSGEVVFSAIYDFPGDRMYWAEKGKGAFCNDEPIHVSNLPLERAFLCWEADHRDAGNRELNWKLREKAAIIVSHTAGWEFIMVASGKLEGRICAKPYGFDYDFAPGAFLVSEAGGMTANLGSRSYDYRDTNLIAANPVIFKELTEGPGALFPIVDASP